jgi:F-type H+-transporting ATPase subunit delta
MTEGALSRRYAKALFQLAREARQEEEIGRELESFLALYQSSALAKTLGSPVFSLPQKKKVFAEVAKVFKLSPLALRFLSILLERERLPYLSTIVARYRRLLDESMGRVRAVVIGSAAIDQAALAEIRGALKKISGKEVLLKVETDPGLLGGVLVELEGKIYDGSVRTQLDKMKERVGRGY